MHKATQNSMDAAGVFPFVFVFVFLAKTGIALLSVVDAQTTLVDHPNKTTPLLTVG